MYIKTKYLLILFAVFIGCNSSSNSETKSSNEDLYDYRVEVEIMFSVRSTNKYILNETNPFMEEEKAEQSFIILDSILHTSLLIQRSLFYTLQNEKYKFENDLLNIVDNIFLDVSGKKNYAHETVNLHLFPSKNNSFRQQLRPAISETFAKRSNMEFHRSGEL